MCHNCCIFCLSGAVVTNRVGIQPGLPQSQPALTDFGLHPYSSTYSQSAVLRSPPP